MNAIKMIIMAVLAMAFTTFPAVAAADQTKQVQKPQVQQVEQVKRNPSKEEYERAKSKTLPGWVGNMCGKNWGAHGVKCERRVVKSIF